MAVQDQDNDTSLNKYISQTGFCSRREADDLIAQGRVFINDEVAASGQRIYAGAVVTVDGEPISKKAKTVYLAFNKPRGITSTTNLTDKTNIVNAINYPKRIFPIGRLDKDSEGLIFLTNDGNIVNKILRAGNHHEKEYIVTTSKPYDASFLKLMSAGVKLTGEGTTLPCKVMGISKSAFRITLVQGLNRQVRRMCDALGYKASSLKRVRIMNITLANLPLGHWRYLTAQEVEKIQEMVAVSSSEDKGKKPTAAKEKLVKPKKDLDIEEKPRGKKKTTDGKPLKKTRTDKKKPAEKAKAPAKKSKTSYRDYRKGK